MRMTGIVNVIMLNMRYRKACLLSTHTHTHTHTTHVYTYMCVRACACVYIYIHTHTNNSWCTTCLSNVYACIHVFLLRSQMQHATT
jgi:hypothetical protein